VTPDSRNRPALDQLRTFVAVYRAESFSAAARQLGLSQPTVTNHVNSLEEWFGTPMFVRKHTGVIPTVYGHEIAATIAEQVDRIDAFLHSDGTQRSAVRELLIGGPHEFMSPVVLPALRSELKRLPKMIVSFGSSSRLLEELQGGRLDLVVSTVRPRHVDLQAWPISDEEFWLVASPALKVTEGSISQLSAIPMVAINRELAIIRRYWNSVYKVEPLFDAALIVPNLLAVKEAVIDGFGMSVLPSYLVADEVESGHLVRLPAPNEPPINTVFLVARKSALVTRRVIASTAAIMVDRIKEFQSTPRAQR